eukprot:CAMPEP_0194214694 /NCGR_PEP_ID=MMETSP0156-20130528/16029_1 /TAXON_ID=33649 /ORGANISM="Thalassionema nitzschioides, Strain L26-B" /LENGTH=347 /DNA_ID=CAMNT_0038943017 /DNA_START=155 /DNA_END=1198 /DNA_ORIENTATION=+
MTEENNDDGMSVDERLAWLRERGVVVETPEERRAQVAGETKDGKADTASTEKVWFVVIPSDTSKPLEELTFDCPITTNRFDDKLLDYLKPMFSAMSSGKDVDLELFRQNATQTLGSSGTPSEVSDEALRQVAIQGNVEKFSLVHPNASNQYVGVNMYLDEVGMLKRLPLNTRASEFATRAGYNPPPQFYGNVFMGRTKTRPRVKHLSLTVGEDTSFDAPWLKQATMDNLAHQMESNQMMGRQNETQPAIDGTDGIEKKEEGYTWTQTEEELEIVLPLVTQAKAKDIKEKILAKSIQVNYDGNIVLALDLFERVDPDGCTWTIDRTDGVKLVLTLEKLDPALWPRIVD